MTYTTSISASGYNSISERFMQLPILAEELYSQTVRENDAFSIISAISSNSLFGESDFFKDGRKIVVTREATSFNARPLEKNQQLIADSVSPEQFTVCTGKKAYKLIKFDKYTMQEITQNRAALNWFMDLIERMVSGVPRETYLPDLIAGMTLECSPKTKGTLAGGATQKFNLGTIAQPRVIKLSSSADANSYLRFVMDLESLLRNLKTFIPNKMFILGGQQIITELTMMMAQGIVPTKIVDSPILSATTGSPIGNKMVNFDFYHDTIMDPFLNASGQLVYPIVFGRKDAYAYGSATDEFKAGDGNDLTTTSMYARLIVQYGGRIMNDEALGVAYITFQP